MSASGLQLQVHVRVRTEALEHAIVRDRLAAGFANRHADAIDRMSADRCFDYAAAGHHAHADRFVLAFHLARFDGTHQSRVCFERPSDHHHTARVLVEPVHDARPRHLRELGVQVQQRVLQSAGRIAGAWMHDQPGGLVDHEDVAILVDDRQLDLLRRDPRDLFDDRSHANLLAPQNLVLGSELLTVDEHLAGLDPLLDAGPGKVAHQLGEHLVQALAGVFDWNGERAPDRFRHVRFGHGGSARDRRNLRTSLPTKKGPGYTRPPCLTPGLDWKPPKKMATNSRTYILVLTT